MVAGIEPRLCRLVPGKAGQPVGDISRIARFRHLAVIDDVDADCRLTRNDVRNGLAHQAVELGFVVGFALVLADQ